MIIKDSKILRKLDYNDQGLINANITKNKLGISSKDDEFAKEQGEILYTIYRRNRRNSRYAKH